MHYNTSVANRAKIMSDLRSHSLNCGQVSTSDKLSVSRNGPLGQKRPNDRVFTMIDNAPSVKVAENSDAAIHQRACRDFTR